MGPVGPGSGRGWASVRGSLWVFPVLFSWMATSWGFVRPAFLPKAGPPCPLPVVHSGCWALHRPVLPNPPPPAPPQMTAWAPSNWTSGPTSPSSPTRPASASEQCRPPPLTPPPQDARSAAITAPGACLFVFRLFILPFLVCIPIPHLLTPISSFFFSPPPNSPQRSQRPCLQDPVLTFVPRPEFGRLSTARPRTRPSGGWRDSGF